MGYWAIKQTIIIIIIISKTLALSVGGSGGNLAYNQKYKLGREAI